MAEIVTTSIKSLPLVYRGKVRDSYAVGDDKLLIVASDRISAFDVILGDAYFRRALPNFHGQYIDFPHFAVSGRG